MSNSDQVLVTGASGFVGSAVARKLAAAGYRVRALVRRSSPRAHLAGVPIEFAEGDLMDAPSLAPAMKGTRYLFHVAADYRLWARDPEEIVRNNLVGTRNIMEAARSAGIQRIVYTSSVATLALTKGGDPVDETAPLKAENAIGNYKRSKVIAERLVEKMIAEQDLPAVIVNPSTPIGPSDVKPTPTGRIIVQAARGKIPGFVDTGLNLVHVDDVADGHLAALNKGKIGERYILGGENVLFSDMLAEIARIVGRKAPWLKVPRAPLIPLAYGAEMIAKFTGKEPFVTLDGLKMSRYRMFFRTEKAARDLGMKTRPFAQGLEDSIAWFRDAGYLTR